MGDIFRHVMSFYCVLRATYAVQQCVISNISHPKLSLWILWVYWSKVHRNQHIFPWCHEWEWGFVNKPLLTWWPDIFVEFVCMFLLKNCPFNGQCGCQYDQACIRDGIVYNLTNFRNFLMLDLGSFNHDISVGEMVSSAVIPNSSAFWTLNKYYLKLFYSAARACHAPKNLAMT